MNQENAPKNSLQKRTKWTKEEDDFLIQQVKQHGNKWSQISKLIPGKSPRECSNRWIHHLNPDLNPDHFTKEEDNIICRNVKEIGKNWEIIAKFLPGRTPISIYNRYNAILEKDPKSTPQNPQNSGQVQNKPQTSPYTMPINIFQLPHGNRYPISYATMQFDQQILMTNTRILSALQ